MITIRLINFKNRNSEIFDTVYLHIRNFNPTFNHQNHFILIDNQPTKSNSIPKHLTR